MKRIIAMLISLAALSSAALSGCGLSPEEIKALEAQILPTAAPVRASKEKERATPAMPAESPTQSHTEATVCAAPSPIPEGKVIQAPEEEKPSENSVTTPVPVEERPVCPSEPTPMTKIDWPYPQITCPPEPSSTPVQDWPLIPAPEPPTYTPEPEPTEPPEEQPTPQPTSAAPAEPAPQPTESPAAPTPETEPTPSPAGGYAVCSCGATLIPEEIVPHMKAHAMSGESHSYRAY